MLLTNNGAALDRADRAKFFIYEPGKRKNYLDWGNAARTARFPSGVYDVVIRFEYDTINEERVWKDVEIIGDYIEFFAFHIPVAHLTVDVNSGGRPIDTFSGSFGVYAPGSDKPLARRRPGETITVQRGTYDVVASYRDPEGLKSKRLSGYLVENHQRETVELGVALSRLTVTLVRNGLSLPGSGAWRLFPIGESRHWIAERRSGETLNIEPGTYDIAALSADGSQVESWLRRVQIDGDVERTIELGQARGSLQVNLSGAEDSRVGDSWFGIFPRGDRSAPLVSSRGSGRLRIAPGTYDIGVFARNGGPFVEKWIEGQRIDGDETLDVSIDLRASSLEIHPRGSRTPTPGPSRMLVLLDRSNAMRAASGTRRKMDLAADALRQVVDGMPSSRVDLGIRLFGSGSDGTRDCNGTRLAVTPDGFDRTAIGSTLDGIEPGGPAPLAVALEAAATDLPPGRGNSIVIVTGGNDSCGGNACEVAARLLRDGVVDRIGVIGFDLQPNQGRSLACIGHYYDATTDGELKSGLRDAVRNATRWSYSGTLAVFDTGPARGWVSGGFIGEKIRIPEGRYDIVMHTQGTTFEWDGVRVVGEFEALAGADAPRGAVGRERK